MVSNRCKIAVKEILNSLHLNFVFLELGEVEVMESLNYTQTEELQLALKAEGFQLMDDRKAVLIEKIKNVIIEMIHYDDDLPTVNYSHHIAEKLHHDYTYLSNANFRLSLIELLLQLSVFGLMKPNNAHDQYIHLQNQYGYS